MTFTPLTAGRDMDRLIHERVFGQHVHDWHVIGHPSPAARRVRMECSSCGMHEWGGYARPGPMQYSTRPDGSEALIAYMFQNGWSLTLHRSVAGCAAYFECAEALSGYSNVWQYPAPATHYEAIARAALDALRLLPRAPSEC